MRIFTRRGSRDRIACTGLPAFTLALAALTAGCAHPQHPASACRSGETAAVADTLYFGTAMPGGRVTARDWDAFLAASDFADGMTHWPASGIWTTSAGERSEEETRVVHIVHPDTEAANRLITDMMTRYRARFRQEAVLRVRTPVCASGTNPGRVSAAAAREPAHPR